MKIFRISMLAAVLAVTVLPTLSHADPHWNSHHGHAGYYHGHDFNHWRAGYWHHGRHGGVGGWWWVVGNSWYFYNRPVYPYPQVVYEEAPPAVIVQAPSQPPAPQMQQPPPPVQNWYYCDNPQGYYPYVANCSSEWRLVPATPPR